MFALLRAGLRQDMYEDRMDRMADRREMRYERMATGRLGLGARAYPPPVPYGGMAPAPNAGYVYPPPAPVYNVTYASPAPQAPPAGYGSPVPYCPPSGYGSPAPYGPPGPPSGYGAPSQYDPSSRSGSPYAPPPQAPPTASRAAPSYPQRSLSPAPPAYHPSASQNRDGQREPTAWVYSAHIDEVRQDLIPGGEENGRPWYIARAPHNGGLIVGKCRPETGAFIGASKEAVRVNAYEVLVGDQRAVKWVSYKGRLNVADLGAQPVEGGHESDGTPLAIARAEVKDDGFMGMRGYRGVFPGKASPMLGGAYVTVDGSEVKVKAYDVLCYE